MKKGNRIWKDVRTVVNDSPYGKRCLTLWKMYKLLVENEELVQAAKVHKMALTYGWSQKCTLGQQRRNRKRKEQLRRMFIGHKRGS